MLDKKTVQSVIDELHLPDFNKATIREIVTIVNKVEALTGERYVRMEMGVPGFPPDKIGSKAEIEALQAGVAARYPMLDGHPELKKQASRFIKAFVDVDVNPEGCIPVSGSMQGTYASFLVSGQADEKKDTVLFIDPGFPVQKTQLLVLGLKYESFDMYEYRGKALVDKVES